MPTLANADPALLATHRKGTNHTQSEDLNTSDHEGITLFARLLKQAGYPGPTDEQSPGKQAAPHSRRDLPLFLRRLEGPNSLKTLAKLFAFQVPVPENEAREALAPLDLERCAALGLLHLHDSKVISKINVSACENLLIVHDPAFESARHEAHPNHVLGISPPTLLLAGLTLRQPARRALDLGAGCGVQALLTAAHVNHVIGVDLNPRAVTFAQFNALLNGIKNVEFRHGNLFEPVHGERFDLIISNPPYVISPESTLLFRDGGKSADGFCEHLVRTLPEYLYEGGFACMLANWVHYAEEHWSAPIRRWVENGGCDCWALHGQEHDPLTYAADWNRHRDREGYDRALNEWFAYYEKLGIKSISSGGIVIRRRAGPANWFRADDFGGGMHQFSPAIVRVFAVEDFLNNASDEDLLAKTLFPQPTHKLTQTMAPGEGDYVVEAMRLEVTHHPPFVASMDANALHLLRRCNGERILRDVLAEVAQLTGGELQACQARGLKIVRGLLAHGVLAPRASQSTNGIT